MDEHIGEKWCARGKHWVTLKGFSKRTTAKDGLQRTCKGCYSVYSKKYSDVCGDKKRAYNKEWRSKYPDKHYNSYLVRNYGVDAQWKRNKFAEQGGRCAICCGGLISWSRAHVDHDHATGVVRGLLCSDCNRGIGLLKDEPSILLSAAVYLGMYGKVVEVADGVA